MTKPLRIAVEGNIGVGKSTLLPKLRDALAENGDDWEVLSERADEDPEFRNLLAEFYKDPNKQAQFQSWITRRRFREFQELAPNPTHFLFERSFLGEVVFGHANLLRHERPDAQYINFFFNSVDALKKCRYDAVVYLQAKPQTCFDRIRYRDRGAESGISYEYVQYLHQCYETHLPETARIFNIPLLTLDWESFGSVTNVADQIATILDDSRQQAIAL